ncbi:hypothetical protein TNCV_1586591 [Trichonephila clavipes]|nr:hypothetical protein TNCV_1586591 [Trichonephila clavipes]
MRSTKDQLVKKGVLMLVKHDVFLWNLPDVEEVPSHDGETILLWSPWKYRCGQRTVRMAVVACSQKTKQSSRAGAAKHELKLELVEEKQKLLDIRRKENARVPSLVSKSALLNCLSLVKISSIWVDFSGHDREQITCFLSTYHRKSAELRADTSGVTYTPTTSHCGAAPRVLGAQKKGCRQVPILCKFQLGAQNLLCGGKCSLLRHWLDTSEIPHVVWKLKRRVPTQVSSRYLTVAQNVIFVVNNPHVALDK